MTITQLDPADSVAVGRWYDLMVAVTRHDLPDFPAPSRAQHTARVVGAASYLLPHAGNSSVVHLELIVHPRHRRRGVGTALLEEVYAIARRHRRSLIEVETVRTRGDHRGCRRAAESAGARRPYR